MSISIEDEVACVAREIKMREHVYPRWVEQKKMTSVKAEQELAVMRAVLERLKAIAAAERPGLF